MSHHQTDKAADDLLDRIAERGEWWRTAWDRLTGVDHLRSQVAELETRLREISSQLEQIDADWVDKQIDWSRCADEVDIEGACESVLENYDWTQSLSGCEIRGRFE